jgi:hypothetical protein
MSKAFSQPCTEDVDHGSATHSDAAAKFLMGYISLAARQGSRDAALPAYYSSDPK